MKWADAINHVTGGAFAQAIAQRPDQEILTGDRPCASDNPCPAHDHECANLIVPVKEVIYTARHWGPAIEHAHYLRDFAAIAELDLHGIHADHCGGYETLAWPCPIATKALEQLLCRECARPRPCPIHDQCEDDCGCRTCETCWGSYGWYGAHGTWEPCRACEDRR